MYWVIQEADCQTEMTPLQEEDSGQRKKMSCEGVSMEPQLI